VGNKEDADYRQRNGDDRGEEEDPRPPCRDETSTDEETENLQGRREITQRTLRARKFIVKLTLATAPEPPKLRIEKDASET